MSSRKLIVAVSSRALIDHSEGSCSGRDRRPGRPGSAFPLVRRLLALNKSFGEACDAVEVIVLSRDTANRGSHLLRSMAEYGIGTGQPKFVSCADPSREAQARRASVFLSTNAGDVRNALNCGVPAGLVLPSGFRDDDDEQLRVAFDFDGVLADDSAEKTFQRDGLDAFQETEEQRAGEPLPDGPLAPLCRQLSRLQVSLAGTASKVVGNSPIRTSIVSSRSAPADQRVLTTLRSWGLVVNDTVFLGGRPKQPVLAELRPHIFFDDQLPHVLGGSSDAPCVHVPFGVANRRPVKPTGAGTNDRAVRAA